MALKAQTQLKLVNPLPAPDIALERERGRTWAFPAAHATETDSILRGVSGIYRKE